MTYKMTMLHGGKIPTTADTEILVTTCNRFQGTQTKNFFSLRETTAKYGPAYYAMNVWFITSVEEVAGSFIIHQRPEENRTPFILTPVISVD